MKYSIKIKQSPEGFAVWCPELPGCASQGNTREEAIENIREAIHDYLEVQKELNEGVESSVVEIL
jgi:predicted RNase H-like HicB family nuclease